MRDPPCRTPSAGQDSRGGHWRSNALLGGGFQIKLLVSGIGKVWLFGNSSSGSFIEKKPRLLQCIS